MSHAKHKPKPASDNLFDRLQVDEFTLFDSPVGNGGALVFRFEQTVEIDDDTFAFPLNNDQMIRLYRLVAGWVGKRGLEELAHNDRLVKLPHEVGH